MNRDPLRVVHASQARRHWSALLGRVSHAGERFLICRNGRSIAAIVPTSEVELLERIVDEADVEEARTAMKDVQGRVRVAWAEMRRFADIQL